MPTQTIQQFSGLDLRDDVQEAQGAVDLLNVELDRLGRARTRDGYTQFVTGGSLEAAYQIIERPSSTATAGQFLVSERLTAGHQNAVTAYDSTGTGLATATTTGTATFVRVGTPTAEYVYALYGSANWRRWDGAAFTTAVGMPSASFATVTPNDNRVVACRVAGNVNRVQFSDPGAPETWGANNYVDLTPGDGENIIGCATWRDKVFVFKETKFFVFYGTSTDSTGQPVFNYRTVWGIGAYAGQTLTRPAVTGTEGVYFFDGRSVWLTTGGPPQRISAAIDPYLQAQTLPLFSSAAGIDRSTLLAFTHLSYVLGRLYMQIPATSGNTTFVYDPQTNQWSLFNLPLRMAIELRLSTDAKEILFLGSDFAVYRYGAAYTTDNGTAITSRYRTGFLDMGAPEQEKWLRQMMLSGTGTVNVKTAVNDATTLSSATSVAMGTSPAVGTGRWSAGTRGRNIGVEVSASSGQWSLSHLSMDIGGIRAAGVRAA